MHTVDVYSVGYTLMHIPPLGRVPIVLVQLILTSAKRSLPYEYSETCL